MVVLVQSRPFSSFKHVVCLGICDWTLLRHRIRAPNSHERVRDPLRAYYIEANDYARAARED